MTASSTSASRDQFTLLPAYVAPKTATEAKIAKIWSRALGIDPIGITDSYEDLGGSSLLAASIFAEIEKTFAVKMEMRMIVDTPTIEDLARKVDERIREARS
jgi:acyl carrier protein